MEAFPASTEGYPKLAKQMGQYPETAIFSRFGDLNAQNLLYLQAELVHLQARLRSYEASNSKSQNGNKALYARDWYWLENSAAEGDGEQWQTMLEIRTKLKEYSEFAIVALVRPHRLGWLITKFYRRRNNSTGCDSSYAGTDPLPPPFPTRLA
jgi:hypothetical protein